MKTGMSLRSICNFAYLLITQVRKNCTRRLCVNTDMLRSPFLAAFLLFFSLAHFVWTAPLMGQVNPSAANVLAEKRGELSLTHTAWDSLLQQYVSESGQVNYKALKANPAVLVAYCQLLADHLPQENWSREEQLAYWINTYNAFTMKLIVDNYPTASILRFDGGKTWDVKRIVLGGKKYSLNQIENEIIRPQFKEPRIHFALNCAAKSCPPLYNHAYTAANLDTVLETRARQFINNPDYNTLSANKATVSKIFDWYGADFGDLKKYLNRYAKTPLKSTATITFKEYDWNLNE